MTARQKAVEFMFNDTQGFAATGMASKKNNDNLATVEAISAYHTISACIFETVLCPFLCKLCLSSIQ